MDTHVIIFLKCNFIKLSHTFSRHTRVMGTNKANVLCGVQAVILVTLISPI